MNHQRPLVLLVEDDRDTAELYQAMLSAEGMEVVCCHDSQQALTWWNHQTRRPDLILTDVLLPDGDGLCLMTELKRRGGFCPPVMVLSAHGDPRTPQRCRQVGVQVFLDKLRDLGRLVSTARALITSGEGQRP